MPQLIVMQRQILTASPTIKPTWRHRCIIFRLPCGLVQAPEGMIYGTLAVHPTQHPPWCRGCDLPPVTITHQGSKLTVAMLDDVDEAVAQTEWLWDRAARVWVEEIVDLALLPQDVLEWCREHCKKGVK